MFRKFVPTLLLLISSVVSHAQEKAADTVIVPLAESSKIIFTVGDPADLEILRHYNFQALFDDILDRLSENAGLAVDTTESADQRRERNIEITVTESASDHQDRDDDDHDIDGDRSTKSRRGDVGRTWQSYNVDLGINNYMRSDQFPTGNELYAVRPWGSWYVGLNSIQRTKLARNFFVEWGMGVSWYNFKFQEDNIRIIEDDSGIHFIEDTRSVDFIKSKLSATFINVSLVPVIDFGEHSHKTRIWEGNREGFRFGVGPYAGYRIASKSKLVYEEDGERKREKERDSFYLNNFRYGIRFQIGVRSTDLFINYDLNDLFAEKKGIQLNAVSFGLIL